MEIIEIVVILIAYIIFAITIGKILKKNSTYT